MLDYVELNEKGNEMKNANTPVNPVTTLMGSYLGVTKREYFAAMAMQGFISAGCQGMPPSGTVADYAVEYADALLAELDK